MKRILAMLSLVALISSCSLLKISTDFGIEPLPVNELNTRLALRLYTTNFNNVVTISADSIISMASNNSSLHKNMRDTIVLAAIKWKRAATITSVGSSTNTITNGAIINCWILAKGMANMSWNVFAEYAPMARESSCYLLKRYREAINPFLEAEQQALMVKFVDSVVAASPLDLNFEIKDYTYEWLKYSNIPDTLIVNSVGSISEVIDDLNHKMGVYGKTAYNQVAWGVDEFEYSVNAKWNDPATQKGLDSIKSSMVLLRSSLSLLPNRADSLVRDVFYRSNIAINSLDYVINRNLDTTFSELHLAQENLTKYITDERVKIISSAQSAANSVVESAIAKVYSGVKGLLIYLLLFVLLIVGVPFYIGFIVGKKR